MNWSLLVQSLPSLLKGASINLQISLIAFSIGISLGITLALIEKKGPKALKALVIAYNTAFRGTPMIIQIFFAYYALPLIGVTLPALAVVILTIGLNSGAYCSQIFLSGLNSIADEQIFAAKALSMSSFQAYRYVIIPQCFRKVVPALSNEMINLLKDSSLASIVGIQEIVKVGNLIRGRTYETFTVFLGVALIYLLMTSIVSLFSKKAQKWSTLPCSV